MMLLWYQNCEHALCVGTALVAMYFAIATILSKSMVLRLQQTAQEASTPNTKMEHDRSLLLPIEQEMKAQVFAIPLCITLLQLFTIQHPSVMPIAQSLDEEESEYPHSILSLLCLREESISNSR